MTDIDVAPREAPDVNTEDLYNVLSDSHRRYVLSYFQRMDDHVAELPELVEWVLTQEGDGRTKQRDAVAIALHHIHLPKLAGYGLIEYDARSKTIRYPSPPERNQMLALVEQITGEE